jgi:hypothetical protein
LKRDVEKSIIDRALIKLTPPTSALCWAGDVHTKISDQRRVTLAFR